MKTTEYRRKLQKLIEDLPIEAERLCIEQAQSGLTIVKGRSTSKGIYVDSLDGNYAEYSTNPIPSWFFNGKQRNQAGSEFIKKNRITTWHQFRQAQGLTSEKVNLSYTNRMWTSISIVRTAQIDGGVMVVIGSTDDRVQRYLPFLAKRYGNFINPTASEKADLQMDTIRGILFYTKTRLT